MYGLLKSFEFFLSEAKYKLRQIYLSSYSQRDEDLVIDRLLKHKKRGFYVDIGANDPDRFSNTKRFYLSGWRGINVDPNTESYLKFVKDRSRDINLNIGISDKKSKLKFYRFFPDTLSTFSSKLAGLYRRQGYRQIDVANIQTLPLSLVLKKYSSKKIIDFLTIDTEGFDERVLHSNDWKKFKPRIICVESNKGQGDKINNYVVSLGYRRVYDNSLNTIYLENND